MDLPPITARATDIPMGTCKDSLDYRERQVDSLIKTCAKLELDINDLRQAINQAELSRDYWLTVIEQHNAACPPEWAIDRNPAPRD